MKDDKNINISVGQLIALVIIGTVFLLYSSAPFFIDVTSPFYKCFTGPFRVVAVLFLIGCAIVADRLTRIPQKKRTARDDKEDDISSK